jgi:hypothetical protein
MSGIPLRLRSVSKESAIVKDVGDVFIGGLKICVPATLKSAGLGMSALNICYPTPEQG